MKVEINTGSAITFKATNVSSLRGDTLFKILSDPLGKYSGHVGFKLKAIGSTGNVFVSLTQPGTYIENIQDFVMVALEHGQSVILTQE